MEGPPGKMGLSLTPGPRAPVVGNGQTGPGGRAGWLRGWALVWRGVCFMCHLSLVRGCGFAVEWRPHCFPEKHEGSSSHWAVISPENLVAEGWVFPEGLAHPACFISSL